MFTPKCLRSKDGERELAAKAYNVPCLRLLLNLMARERATAHSSEYML